MSVNRFLPHVLILPEDDADRQIANGFLLRLHYSVYPRIQVLREAGGWCDALDRFESEHMRGMNRYSSRYMILLIDGDGNATRCGDARKRIPGELMDRVFILGVLSEPEELKRDFGPYEEIGRALADDCRENADKVWSHRLLRHNTSEVDRMRKTVRPFLFPSI